MELNCIVNGVLNANALQVWTHRRTEICIFVSVIMKVITHCDSQWVIPFAINDTHAIYICINTQWYYVTATTRQNGVNETNSMWSIVIASHRSSCCFGTPMWSSILGVHGVTMLTIMLMRGPFQYKNCLSSYGIPIIKISENVLSLK